MLGRIVQTIERHGMFDRCRRVGVAVSGGADSVCLLEVLRELAPRWGLTLVVLHLDHGLRGEESRRDAEFVRELAARMDLTVTIRRAELSRTGNLEQAGRQARLAFFREQLATGGVDRVALGHTRTDQAETVLFRFLRGAGTAGLAGIRPVTAEGIVRPLIEVDRREVESYLRERGIEWREDSSNRSVEFARNRIRHELLPQLTREWNPGLAETLARTADWALAEEAYWEGEIDRLAAGRLTEHHGAVLLRAEDLAALPLAAARRLVRRAMERAKGDLRSLGFDHIRAVLELAVGAEGHGQVQAPGLEIVRSFEWLRLARSGESEMTYEVPAPVPGVVRIPGSDDAIALELIENSEISEAGESVHAGQYVYNSEMGCLEWTRVSKPLWLRSWRQGDRYRPAGRSGEEKIKTLFQEARIPLWERSGWPVLTDGAGIVWARKFGPAAGLAADGGSGPVLRIRGVARLEGKLESAERGTASNIKEAGREVS